MHQSRHTPLPGRMRLAVAAVLLIALAFRCYGLGFGLPALYDPDEPLFVLNAVRLLHDHTLNPHWFGHPGTTTLYALALVDVAVFGFGLAAGWWSGAAAFARAIYANAAILWLPDRAFILVCGVLCVWLTWRLGRRLFGAATGLVAALLLAVDPLHIKYSQIIRTDVQGSVFVLLCALTAAEVVRSGRWRSYAWAGVWLGIGIATKWPFALAALLIVGAAAARMIEDPVGRRTQALRLAAALALALVALVAASPFLILDHATVVHDLTQEGRPYHLGATGRGVLANAGWYLTACLRPALGVLGLIAAVAGLAVGARQSRFFALAVLPFLAVLFVVICSQHLIWDRWSVPLLPFLSLAAAVAVVGLCRVNSAGPRLKRLTTIFVLIGVIVPPAATAIAGARERVNDTRRQSTAWLVAHVPPGSRVMAEYLALDLLNRGWHMLFPVGDGGCVDVDRAVNGQIDYATINRWRGDRPIIDFGTMNPARVADCAADYAVLVDYDRYLAEAASGRYGQQIDNYRRLIARGTIVATFRPEPGRAGGWVVRIVRLKPAT